MIQTDLQTSDAEKLRQRNRELAILNGIAQALNRSVNLNQALQAALSQCADLFGMHTGWIWLVDDRSGEISLAAVQNLPPGLANNPELMQGSCYCLDTYRAGDMAGAANINVITCSRLKKLVDGTAGLRYHASVPLNAGERQLGVLNVASSDWRELTDEDLRLMHTLGDMLSIAIERARLFARSARIGALEERNRLAREIHDTLAQSLAGITLQLESAEALLDAGSDPQRVQRAVSQALIQARLSLEDARRSVLDLRAAPLESRSLAQALEILAQNGSIRGGKAIEYRLTGKERSLPARVEEGLYRICQEAVSNITRHAGAAYASLQLEFHPEEVKITVEDHGRGFDPENLPPGHYGLVGISERARLMGGALSIQSSPDEGTHIEVTIPISSSAEEMT
jgi:two-component system NarL family sensor kinase